ncbi:HHL210Wp [Eremothecium sinecaudum]|uniref:HHL210Wp n=1 Tax=Eremothecium sinecaudum TaxID=45286 RepID=A0A109V080_9SACH|nr:HHL210Wp [Eremothecium sinecaudum]AMD22560.1 HHL210Wp [Eremothecium sinecaudum]
MDPLSRYKQAVQQRLDNADLAVSKIVRENTLLSQQVINKDEELQSLREEVKRLQQDAKREGERREKAGEEVEITKDLFEHLCGVRVHKLYEDDTGLWFDTSQGSKNGVMDYKLGFVKNAETQDTEVVYIPLLKRRSASELKALQAKLPGYMFDTLSFPLGSLNQFYNKLSRCLGKSSAPEA